MKHNVILALMGILSGLLIATSASALGIGAYIEAGGGESYRSVSSKSLESTGGTLTNYGFKAGLVIDTCVACDELFSYRLKIGGGRSWSDLMSKSVFNGIYLSNIFAFAVVKNDFVKFWIGPQIGLNYRRGSSDRIFIGTEVPGPLYLALFLADFTHPYYFKTGPYKELVKYTLYGGDAGVTFGLNLNLGDLVTLAFEAGLKYSYHRGKENRKVYNEKPAIYYRKFTNSEIIEHGVEGYGSFAFLFRFVDTYQ